MFGRAGSSLHEPLHSASPDDDEFAVPLADADYELTDSSWSTEGLNAAFGGSGSATPARRHAGAQARARQSRRRARAGEAVRRRHAHVRPQPPVEGPARDLRLPAAACCRAAPLEGRGRRTHVVRPARLRVLHARRRRGRRPRRRGARRRASRWPNAAIVPAMAGMCAGWALGDAGVQALVEIDHQSAAASAGDASGSGEAAPTHNSANLAFAAVVTLASAVVILALQATPPSAAAAGRGAPTATPRRAACGGAGRADVCAKAARRRRTDGATPRTAAVGSGRAARLAAAAAPTALQAATSTRGRTRCARSSSRRLPKDERGGPCTADARLWAATLTDGLALVSTKSVACPSAGSARGGAAATRRWRRRSSASSS